ncbi:MAG: glycosyltransferase [Spirochaetaceae bacterium]|nr:MAG: glycosyltransferase [Spirochaetaceae bacterium]
MIMFVGCLNPQGNFDPGDYGWTQHPDFGGQLVYVKELALALSALGQRVDILTRRIEDPDWPVFAGFQDGYPGHENVRILRFPCGPPRFLPKEELWPHLEEWVANILAFYDRERSYPDVFAGHYADGGLAAILIQEKRETPFTFTGHSLGAQKMDKTIHDKEDFDGIVERFHFDRRIIAERLSMARSARIITSTEQERREQYAHRLYRDVVDPAAHGKFAVIPPGVNLDIFGRDRKNRSEEKTVGRIKRMMDRGIPASRRELATVICSSRLDRKKNHLGLVRAWVVSEELRRAANLVIVTRGVRNPLQSWEADFNGEERSVFGEIVRQIQENDLQGCVSAFDLNSQEELAACYRYLSRNKRGIFALSSVYEPFGLAPLEAMAAGLPAVVTRNGGPTESLQDNDGAYGILVDPENPEDIAGGILRLARDESFREAMWRRGEQRILDRYTWQRTAEGYLAEFNRIQEETGAGKRTFRIPEDLGKSWLRNLYYGGSV